MDDRYIPKLGYWARFTVRGEVVTATPIPGPDHPLTPVDWDAEPDDEWW